MNKLKLELNQLAVQSFSVSAAYLGGEGPIPAEGAGTKLGYCSFDGPCATGYTDCPCA